jgi:small-conductance mechanosensitive channel
MRTLVCRFLIVLTLCLPLALWAQDTNTPNYTDWDSFASGVESELRDGAPDDATLEGARATLVTWRGAFLDAESANSARIQTLQAQIKSLGAGPEEGGSEPNDVAVRRTELAKQLETATAPVRQAEESFTRADGLIGEIDSIMIARQTDALMELGPTPLNPVIWPQAIKDISDTALNAWRVAFENLLKPAVQATLKANGASILFFTTLAVFLLLRGRKYTDLASQKVQGIVSGQAGRGVSGFVGSLGQVIVPVVGLLALAQAAKITGVLGERGQAISEALPEIGFAFFAARWLASRVLYATETAQDTFDLNAPQQREASGHFTLMALMLALNALLADLAQIDSYSAGTLNVLRFPLVVLTAFSLFRLAQILISVDRVQDAMMGPMESGSSSGGFVALMTRSVAKILRPAAMIAILLGAVGYMPAAIGIVYPAVLSLALLSGLLVASRFVADLYCTIVRRDPEEADGLVPVLISIGLFAGAVPLFALVWGMRPDQIWEIWTLMQQGIPLGDAQLSIPDVLTVLIVFAIGFGLTRLLKAALASTILPKTRLDRGGQQAVVSGTGYVGVFLSAVVAIMAAGIDLSALALVAGALSVGIGFGLQNIVQNFVSGIILLIERPVSKGDWIEVGGQMGFVRDISVRSTRIETFDRTDVIVPNADLISNAVTNYTRGNSLGRVTIKVGVAYGTDTRRVETILNEIIEAQSGIVSGLSPQVLFIGFGADSMDFEVRAILVDVTTILKVTSDVNHQIAARFAEENIEIPFAQRDIWLRNPEALRGSAARSTTLKTKPEIDPDAQDQDADTDNARARPEGDAT